MAAAPRSPLSSASPCTSPSKVEASRGSEDEDLICAVCRDYSTKQVFQCREGHIFCSECYAQIVTLCRFEFLSSCSDIFRPTKKEYVLYVGAQSLLIPPFEIGSQVSCIECASAEAHSRSQRKRYSNFLQHANMPRMVGVLVFRSLGG
jgi:hypothetical protein